MFTWKSLNVGFIVFEQDEKPRQHQRMGSACCLHALSVGVSTVRWENAQGSMTMVGSEKAKFLGKLHSVSHSRGRTDLIPSCVFDCSTQQAITDASRHHAAFTYGIMRSGYAL
jgi:hypothetical protein